MIKVLLDTNIIIHRESSRILNSDIGNLFRWLDDLGYMKCIHPKTIEEISAYQDKKVVDAFNAKMKSYNVLKTIASDTQDILRIRKEMDNSSNDEIDTSILNELCNGRVDFLITEDRGIHRKADKILFGHLVFTIDGFLEKVTAENPDLTDYKVLSIRRKYMGNISLDDSFFETLISDYPGFEKWYNKKSDEYAYVSYSNGADVVAFLYLKKEGDRENYFDITPTLLPAKRLKIGIFKVTSTGFKLGERFIKIIFDNAMQFKVDEIYVTIFDKTPDQRRLIELLKDWGFREHGVKESEAGIEKVLVRDFRSYFVRSDPKQSYPYISAANNKKFIVPIRPEYHTDLLPDSILHNEKVDNFIENQPQRNAIEKVYVSRAPMRSMKRGDVLVFYRTASGGPAKYTSVITTLGIVQQVHIRPHSLSELISLCRKRSVFSDDDLKNIWNENANYPPMVMEFLYVCTFEKPRMNLNSLVSSGILQQAPRSIDSLSEEQFKGILEGVKLDMPYIIS